MRTIRVGNREITFFTLQEYCHAYRRVVEDSCNVRTYLKYIIAKLVYEKILQVSPLEVYVLYSLATKGRLTMLDFLKSLILDMVRMRRNWNGAVTIRTVESVLREVQREVEKHGIEGFLRKYLPEKWF